MDFTTTPLVILQHFGGFYNDLSDHWEHYVRNLQRRTTKRFPFAEGFHRVAFFMLLIDHNSRKLVIFSFPRRRDGEKDLFVGPIN